MESYELVLLKLVFYMQKKIGVGHCDKLIGGTGVRNSHVLVGNKIDRFTKLKLSLSLAKRNVQSIQVAAFQF